MAWHYSRDPDAKYPLSSTIRSLSGLKLWLLLSI
jgi:hypothetical protein